jgi:hypothetical protein
MKLILSIAITLISLSAMAGSPKFNKNGKMKSAEVFQKCGEWASKETSSIKDEKKMKEQFLKAAESCSLNNGFDSKGDQGNEMWSKYGRR